VICSDGVCIFLDMKLSILEFIFYKRCCVASNWQNYLTFNFVSGRKHFPTLKGQCHGISYSRFKLGGSSAFSEDTARSGFR
jgi:hypothetical protein